MFTQNYVFVGLSNGEFRRPEIKIMNNTKIMSITKKQIAQ